jgi:hypothetical protein
MSREEIIYNSRALLSTWLDGKEYDGVFTIECCNGGSVVDSIVCSRNDCGEHIGDILYSCHGVYDMLRVVVEGKTIGSIDVI